MDSLPFSCSLKMMEEESDLNYYYESTDDEEDGDDDDKVGIKRQESSKNFHSILMNVKYFHSDGLAVRTKQNFGIRFKIRLRRIHPVHLVTQTLLLLQSKF